MEQTAIYDTHEAVKGYMKVGFTEQQAEYISHQQKIFSESQLATRADVIHVQQQVETLRQETTTQIETLRQETKHDIALIHKEIEALRKETTTQIEILRQQTKNDIALVYKETESIRRDIKSMDIRLRDDMKLMESRIILRLGGLTTALFAILGGFIGILQYMH